MNVVKCGGLRNIQYYTMAEFDTIGLVSRVANEQIRESLVAVTELLNKSGVSILVDHTAASMLETGAPVATWDGLGEQCDLLIAVGGDGNILSAARAMAPHGVPILGINRGKLGFLADVSPDQIESQLSAVLAGDYTTEEHFLLEGIVDGQEDDVPSALNEVLVHSANMPKMIEMELYVDDRFVYTQNSDGLIVSSPTGSTAYALSAGGPIMHPSLDAIVLVPMFPHSLTNRPLVVPGSGEIRIVISPATEVEAKVSFDSHLEFRIKPGDSLTIRKKKERLKLVHPPGHSFYEICRSKLDWASRTADR